MISRVRNYFDFVIVEHFVREALRTCPFVNNVDEATLEVRSAIADDDVALLIGQENGANVALVLMRDNTSSFMRGVNITHIYLRGTPTTRNELLEAINDYTVLRGAKMVWGVDVNQRAAAYERLFRKWAPQRRGILYTYDSVVKNEDR